MFSYSWTLYRFLGNMLHLDLGNMTLLMNQSFLSSRFNLRNSSRDSILIKPIFLKIVYYTLKIIVTSGQLNRSFWSIYPICAALLPFVPCLFKSYCKNVKVLSRIPQTQTGKAVPFLPFEATVIWWYAFTVSLTKNIIFRFKFLKRR